jgi:probable sporulation protein (polysaccharide deacetylase family)
MEVSPVKAVFIPFRRNQVFQMLAVLFLIILLIALGSGETLTVFSRAVNQPIYKGNEENPIIAFECNVVWGTEYIAPMLDILKQHDIRITFFIGGEWARDNPQLLERIADEEHEIGNHGFYHKHHSKLNLDENIKEITETEKIIESVTGIKTSLFAPPYGEFNDITIQAADSLGYHTIMWSIDTIDWRRDGAEKIIHRVLKNPRNGALVLMHPTADTLTALPIIIEKLQSQGYRIGTVSEAIGLESMIPNDPE